MVYEHHRFTTHFTLQIFIDEPKRHRGPNKGIPISASSQLVSSTSSSSSSIPLASLSSTPPANQKIPDSTSLGTALRNKKIFGFLIAPKKYRAKAKNYILKYDIVDGFWPVKDKSQKDLLTYFFQLSPPGYNFDPSDEQLQILNWIDQPAENHNAIIEACAGSGKTTTLGLCAKKILLNNWNNSHKWPDSVLYLTFGRELVSAMISLNLFNVQAMTFHSLASNLLKISFTNNTKESDLSIVTESDSKKKSLITSAMSIFGIELDPESEARYIKCGEECLKTLFFSANRDYQSFITEWTRQNIIQDQFPNFEQVLNDCVRIVIKNDRFVDFDSSIWLPRIRQSEVTRVFKWIFIDEAQDLNAAQIALVMYLSETPNTLWDQAENSGSR